MKTKKLVFLFCILFSMLATNALAYDFAVKNSDGVMIYYNYNSNKTAVYVTYKSGYVNETDNGYSGSVAIPKEITYNNITLKVTKIGNEAFWDCNKVTSVTIPNSVTSIGWGAFAYCKEMTSITIPNSVTTIDGHAFKCCKSLTSLPIPNNLKIIKDEVFRGCDKVTSVTIPNSVTNIENEAFWGCI